MAIELPTKPIPAVTQDPKNLILFGQPKVGKSTTLSVLPNNLILDIEDGSDYISGLKIKAKNVKEIKEICNAIKEAGCPYDFITIDTITALEDMAKPLALQLYKKTPAGQADVLTKDVLTISHGGGYGFLRTAIEQIIDWVQSVTKHVILVGHIKEKSIANAQGVEVGSVKDLDLLGKTSRVLSSRSDAIGYVFRDKDSNLCIDFKNDGDVSVGARPPHLANKRIIVAEKLEDGTFKSHWEDIYPSLNK